MRAMFSGGTQLLTGDPNGGDPNQYGSTLDGADDEQICLAASQPFPVDLSYPLSKGQFIFYNSNGGGWVQLSLEDMPAEPLLEAA